MEGLACEHCRHSTTEFTILQCDHVVCAECLWSEVKTTLQGANSITCTCGQSTIFASQSKRTNQKTQKKETISQLQTEMSVISGNTPSLNVSRSMLNSQKSKGELNIELQFLDVQFKKTVEQAQHNFEKLLRLIREKYTSLIKSIKIFWQQEILQSESMSLLNFPVMLSKKYEKQIGWSIKNLNESLISSLSSFRMEGKQSHRILSSPGHIKSTSSISKENYSIINCEQQKQKLFKAIENLKLRNESLRKGGRRERPIFQRM